MNHRSLSALLGGERVACVGMTHPVRETCREGWQGSELYRVSTTSGRTPLRCPRRKQAGQTARTHEEQRDAGRRCSERKREDEKK